MNQTTTRLLLGTNVRLFLIHPIVHICGQGAHSTVKYNSEVKKSARGAIVLWLSDQASASKSEDFLEVVRLQATFPSAHLERELIALLRKNGERELT